MKRYVYAQPKKNIPYRDELDLCDKLATRWALRAEKLIKSAKPATK